MIVSSVAAISGPSAVYREDQLFAWWTYSLLAASTVMSAIFLAKRPGLLSGGEGLGATLAVAAGFLLPVLLAVTVLRMTVVVTPAEVVVWFGWIPSYRRRVPIGSVVSARAVTYRPLVDCGGWGIRTGRDGERVLNANGNRGVRLTLTDGSSLLIGSQSPDALAASIEALVCPSA